MDLDNILKNPSKYYHSDTVDLILMALGNARQCRIVVYECTETKTWTNDLITKKSTKKFFILPKLSHII